MIHYVFYITAVIYFIPLPFSLCRTSLLMRYMLYMKRQPQRLMDRFKFCRVRLQPPHTSNRSQRCRTSSSYSRTAHRTETLPWPLFHFCRRWAHAKISLHWFDFRDVDIRRLVFFFMCISVLYSTNGRKFLLLLTSVYSVSTRFTFVTQF